MKPLTYWARLSGLLLLMAAVTAQAAKPVDNDGDGYGIAGLALCTFPDFDCNDNAPNINPGADENSE